MKTHLPKAFFLLLILGLSLLPLPLLAQTESETLTLSLRRDWGYGGFSGDIQGTFTMRAEGSDDLTRVDFYIDDTMIGSITQPPWNYQLKTDNYALGVHNLYASGYTAAGTEMQSNVIVREFVTAGQGWQMVGRIIVPILVLILLVSVAGYLIDRRRGTSRRGYGRSGGAVCPKCSYPFGRHWWAPNIGVGKYDRCPNCGKWSRVGKATSQELAAAEAIHFSDQAVLPEQESEDPEETLRKRLEESKYDEV